MTGSGDVFDGGQGLIQASQDHVWNCQSVSGVATGVVSVNRIGGQPRDMHAAKGKAKTMQLGILLRERDSESQRWK